MRLSRRTALGAGAALGLEALATLALVPLRGHVGPATPGIVLVIPVVVATVVGGPGAGLAGALTGFVDYDVFFIPPYGSPSVASADGWAALGVYVVVTIAVSRVVANLDRARALARRRELDALLLLELSDRMVADRPLPDLLAEIVTAAWEEFALESVALLLPDEGGVRVAAQAGRPLSAEDIASIAPGAAVTLRPGASTGGRPGLLVAPLKASARPLGLLALRGAGMGPHERDLLQTFVNHAAFAVERGQLRESAMRAAMLEESDRWRQALMGAVSHDLRTPLASIKASVSDLRDPGLRLSEPDRAELLELVDSQTDRLSRLVANLLDMTRIQAGTLALRTAPAALGDLLDEALAGLAGSLAGVPVVNDLPPGLPMVEVDHVLVAEAIANLLDNAARHSPAGEAITFSARPAGPDAVEVSVSDRGPGVDPADRERVFRMFNRVGGGGRAGLGLAIVKAFVEAHGQAIRVEGGEGGGARFVFGLPTASPRSHATPPAQPARA